MSLGLESDSLELDRKQEKVSATQQMWKSESINQQQLQIWIPIFDVGFKDTLVVWYKTLCWSTSWKRDLGDDKIMEILEETERDYKGEIMWLPHRNVYFFYCWSVLFFRHYCPPFASGMFLFILHVSHIKANI